MRRLISRVVVFSAIILGIFGLGANSAFTPHRTADAWPNPLVVTTDPWQNPLVDTSDPWPNPLTVDGAQVQVDSVVGGV